MRHAALLLLIPLAACGSPRQECERNASRDLSVVNALIVETEQNIARGYAIEREVESRPTLTFCYGDKFGTGTAVFTYCNDIEVRTVEKPVAIDLAAEKSKLAGLRAKEAELRARTLKALDMCRAQYPDA